MLPESELRMSTRILALVGSLRAGSYNRQLAEAAVKHAPDGTNVEIFEGLAEVPFYNEDLDRPGHVPDSAQGLRNAVHRADALLLVTPEYNGSMPAGLKNAIDWASRPFHVGVIADKPVAVVGTSSGRYGGVWAHDAARITARLAGAHVLDNLVLSVPRAAERFATTHPADDDDVAATIPEILATLAATTHLTTKEKGMTSIAHRSVDNRRRDDEVRGFKASSALADNLEQVLVDLVELHLQGKQAHWNVVGTNFRDLHLQLDELVDFARNASDTVAERMRALDAAPDGRSDTVVAATSLPQISAEEINTTAVVDLITTRIYATVDTLRTARHPVEAEDPSTADILDQLIEGLEKLAWLIKSENRRA